MSNYCSTNDMPDECLDCGALVTDKTQHNLWHEAIRDLADWISRVAGSSCETARSILSTPHTELPDLTHRNA